MNTRFKTSLAGLALLTIGFLAGAVSKDSLEEELENGRVAIVKSLGGQIPPTPTPVSYTNISQIPVRIGQDSTTLFLRENQRAGISTSPTTSDGSIEFYWDQIVLRDHEGLPLNFLNEGEEYWAGIYPDDPRIFHFELIEGKGASKTAIFTVEQGCTRERR